MAHKLRPYQFYDTAVSICATCYRRVDAKIVFQDGEQPVNPLVNRIVPDDAFIPHGCGQLIGWDYLTGSAGQVTRNCCCGLKSSP